MCVLDQFLPGGQKHTFPWLRSSPVTGVSPSLSLCLTPTHTPLGFPLQEIQSDTLYCFPPLFITKVACGQSSPRQAVCALTPQYCARTHRGENKTHAGKSYFQGLKQGNRKQPMNCTAKAGQHHKVPSPNEPRAKVSMESKG